MHKVIITTVLDPEIKSKLTEHSKKTYIPYSKLIEYAINDFNSLIKDNSDYSLKFANFDRLKTQSFTCSIPGELNDQLISLAKRLGISKRLLVREVVCLFIQNLD